ncbi:MAG: glycogen/starch synthase [bacterium]
MKILIAASEMSPFARSGDLADFVEGMSVHLAEAGHEVTVVLPFYRCVRENKALAAKRSRVRFSVPVGGETLPCEIWEAAGPHGARLRFLQREEFFDRTGLYGVDGRDYQDNAARFIFFSKCVTELARLHLPDTVHLIGWQAAMAAVFMSDQKLQVPTVLSPFSLDYQGNFWSHDFALTNLPGSYFSSKGLEFYGSMNFLKAGIVFADAVVLPGGRFVAEAQTQAHGCGLENVLREFSSKLEGIAPGFDETDLPAFKSDAKASLAARRGFFPQANAASARVFVVDSESSGRSGIDLILQALDLIPSPDFCVVLLGGVADSCLEALNVALRRHAARFVHVPWPDEDLAERALSAGDFLLVPGALEPRSAFVAAAMCNGLVPVVEHCAGLLDLVRDFDPVNASGNGLVFYRHSLPALADSLKRALFMPSGEFQILSSRVRESDFSWRPAVARMEKLQTRLLLKTGRLAA